ncbi:MAG: cupin domain-containing protein [Dehalococcoidia bacterium]|nr:cupin domain-containing protein [Dehalococcoidia bacterium]
MAEDPVQVAGDVYKAVLENDRVRVLEVRMKPGDKTPMHAHPDLVAVVVRGGRLRFTTSDGQSTEAEIPDGQPMFFEATEHTTENIGTTEFHAFLAELK